jgi:hypothetical protein
VLTIVGPGDRGEAAVALVEACGGEPAMIF